VVGLDAPRSPSLSFSLLSSLFSLLSLSLFRPLLFSSHPAAAASCLRASSPADASAVEEYPRAAASISRNVAA
jgi:hypothetical protein